MKARLRKSTKADGTLRYDIELSSSREDENSVLKSMKIMWPFKIWAPGKHEHESPEELYIGVDAKLTADEEKQIETSPEPNWTSERNTLYQNKLDKQIDWESLPHFSAFRGLKAKRKFECACGWCSKTKKLDRKHKKNCSYLLSLAELFARVRKWEVRHGLRDESKASKKARKTVSNGKWKRDRVVRRNRRRKKSHKGA